MNTAPDIFRDPAIAIHIPIKTTNERLPGKNTRLLGGRPLHDYLFSTLRKLGNVPVYIDSSDAGILQTASQWGFHPLARPRELDGNTITGNELLARALPLMDASIIGQLHVTSPFLRTETIRKAFALLAERAELDAVFGVRPLHNRFWFAGRPVNHDPDRLQRTQELEPVYEETDFYFFRKASFLRYGRRVAGKTERIVVDPVEAVDIDTLQDFLHAEALVQAGVVRFD